MRSNKSYLDHRCMVQWNFAPWKLSEREDSSACTNSWSAAIWLRQVLLFLFCVCGCEGVCSTAMVHAGGTWKCVNLCVELFWHPLFSTFLPTPPPAKYTCIVTYLKALILHFDWNRMHYIFEGYFRPERVHFVGNLEVKSFDF